MSPRFGSLLPLFAIRRIVLAQVAALVAVLCCLVPLEWAGWQELRKDGADWTVWLISLNVETWLILMLPYFWLVRRPFWSPPGRWWIVLRDWWLASPRFNEVVGSSSFDTNSSRVIRRGTVLAMVMIAATSLCVSGRVGMHRVGNQQQYRFAELPPAYHDEYSYLFQARTFLAGRWSYPSHPTAARLFDQMHVVNEGRFASRYFPGTGLFIAPWLWLGCPLLGYWLAGAATCVLVFGIGRELSNNGTGLIAGMLTALSPGMALFGNLMLAHHPTLLGVLGFAWCFLRWQRRGRLTDIALAGVGLSWAMLCRPMTAAGFALPFGIWFGWRLLKSWRARPVLMWRAAFGLVVPLAVGFSILAAQNDAITGDWTKSPYQLFTETYTPRHGYGFNNVIRGEQHLGPKVLDNYDRWAENLTPALAVTNAKNRLLASWQWTLGLIPLLAATVVFTLTGNDRDRRCRLIFAAILSLFAVHVPYWFDGMFQWHYVFETGPLWCLLLATVVDSLGREWLIETNPHVRMPVWLTALVFSAMWANHMEFGLTESQSKLLAGADQIAFSRLRYQAFDELLAREIGVGPALVLIEADPADRHIDYVVNEPSLSAPILRGRFPVADWPLERIAASFPDRTLYVFHAKSRTLRRVF